jgi:hypothetical protein
MKTNITGYIFAAFLGALAGGVGVAIATRALPKMMAQAMSNMMQRMSAQMAERGIQPDT